MYFPFRGISSVVEAEVGKVLSAIDSESALLSPIERKAIDD